MVKKTIVGLVLLAVNYVLNGNADDVGMINPSEGWATGSKMENGMESGVRWHWITNTGLTPTSLGRVMATFM